MRKVDLTREIASDVIKANHHCHNWCTIKMAAKILEYKPGGWVIKEQVGNGWEIVMT